MNDETPGHITTGNVFDDLGLLPQRSLEEKLKYQVHAKILEAIVKNKLSPRAVEKRIDKPQSRVSELLNGKISGISFKMLCNYLEALGGNIELNIKLKKIA